MGRRSWGGCLLVVVCAVIAFMVFVKPPQNNPIDNEAPKSAPTSEKPSDKKLRAMLSNARALVKAKVYPPARDKLKQIINESPGTPEADEAKQVLDSIPK